MKKSCVFVLALLLIGSFAFAQEEGSLTLELDLGGGMSFNNDKDLGSATDGRMDLRLRAYLLDLGNEFQPFKVGIAVPISLAFPSVINWRVPGLEKIEKEPSGGGNAFWPGGYTGTGESATPNPVQVGSQTLLPGKVVTFDKAKDFGESDSLLNLTILFGPSVQVGFSENMGIVADLGVAFSMDFASFNSPEYTNGETNLKEKMTIELSTFDVGVGANLGFQYRVPGSITFVIEVGSGLYYFVSRTSQVNWYSKETVSGEKHELWKEESADAESVGLFRAAPYLTIGFSF